MPHSIDPTAPRVVATLVYDTSAQPLASGVRAVLQRARRLLYAADEAEVVLQASPSSDPGHVALIGQVLDEGLPVAGATVRLDHPDHALDRTTDDEGEFRVQNLPNARYALTVGMPDRALTVPALDLAG